MALPLKIGLIGGVLCLVSVTFGWGIIPAFVKNKIAQRRSLIPNSDARRSWEKLPFAITFKVCIFNITNVEEVHEGQTPIVHEVGPYFFDEYKEKVDVFDEEQTDTVTFYMKNTFYFNRVKSAPLTGDEIVHIPNVAMLGIMLSTEKDRPLFLGIIAKALVGLFNEPENVFIRTTAMDFLFRGNLINCTGTEYSVKSVCSVLARLGTFPEIEPGIFSFSMFGTRNGTKDPNEYRVKRGIKDVADVGQMVSYNGKTEMNIWAGQPCNSINGTDGTIFPPFIERQDIPVFSSAICRSVVQKYSGVSLYKAIPTMHYSSDFGDMTSNPSEKCFCSTPTKCLKKGVLDLSKCLGAPIIASLPHFYGADESYSNAVRGLYPQQAKHSIGLDFEPITGTPLKAKSVVQFALPIHPVNKVNISLDLPEVFLPFIWIEEGFELSDVVLAELDAKLFSVLRNIDVGKWIATATGAGLSIIGTGLHFFNPFSRDKLVMSVSNAGESLESSTTLHL